ncbi:hypothetical protein [Flagellimonas abyssi]|uniref:Coiled-coil domain-containing protein 167 n=1 Tax=Flagellimonas abyssi TaxID=2864871 RepID=A0ABS7EWM3_9FLAO|nr:hypothetical protein [Allomuricauda abyssi]MBW8201871.1 hypothetical protein [Allomuricauda abyssi]
MGGEGSMASAILSLKQNRSLLKKRNIRELKDLIYEKSDKTDLAFKEISPEELARIKEEIRMEAKLIARNEAILYSIVFVFALGLVAYLSYLFFSALPE